MTRPEIESRCPRPLANSLFYYLLIDKREERASHTFPKSIDAKRKANSLVQAFEFKSPIPFFMWFKFGVYV